MENENILQDRFYGRQPSQYNYSKFSDYLSRPASNDSDRDTVASVGRGQTPARAARRISVREATPETPDYQKNLYNYNFKDKWDQSLAQAGISSSLEPPDPDNIHSYGSNRKRSNQSTAASSESSAWGSKYDNVDRSRQQSRDDNSRFNKYSKRRQSEDQEENNDNKKAWFVEL